MDSKIEIFYQKYITKNYILSLDKKFNDELLTIS